MARVHHPNVVAVHDYGVVDGRPFLVMEYIEGGDLRQQMETGTPWPAARVLGLIGPVTQALEYLQRARHPPPGPQAREHLDGP